MALHTVLNGLFFLRKEIVPHSRESSRAFEYSHFASTVLESNIKWLGKRKNSSPRTEKQNKNEREG